MTCREKLAMEHPDLIDDVYAGGCANCPSSYDYLDKPDYCGKCVNDCYLCWNREIPEETEKEKPMTNTKKTKAELLSEIAGLEKQLKDLEKYKEMQDCADDLKAVHNSLMNAGFSNEQAFEILKTTMANLIPNLTKGMHV